MQRRRFIGNTLKASAAMVISTPLISTLVGCSSTKNAIATTKGQLPIIDYKITLEQAPLAYAYNALNSYIDEATMTIHHTKHATAYLKNAKEAWDDEVVKKNAAAQSTILSVLNDITKYSPKMHNHLGGHFNHELFWKCLTPNSTGKATGVLLTAIEKSFGSFDNFKTQFSEAGKNRFGSGWAWLTINEKKELIIQSTANQDNPIMAIAGQSKGLPILGLDVWEHAYYLKYQNKRADYINAFWNIVNWDYVESLFKAFV